MRRRVGREEGYVDGYVVREFDALDGALLHLPLGDGEVCYN